MTSQSAIRQMIRFDSGHRRRTVVIIGLWVICIVLDAGAFQLPGGGETAPVAPAAQPGPTRDWHSADNRLRGVAPAKWALQVRKGKAGLRSTMDVFGGSSLQYRDTRPRPNQYTCFLGPTGDIERVKIAFHARYEPVNVSTSGDAWSNSLDQLRAYAREWSWLKPAGNPTRTRGHEGVPGAAATFVETDDDETTLRRVVIQQVGPVIYQLTIDVTAALPILQRYETGLNQLTSSVTVNWPRRNAALQARLPGTYRARIFRGNSRTSTAGDKWLSFHGDGRFVDIRDTRTGATGYDWSGDVTGWVTSGNQGLFGKGRYLVVDGFLILIYEWVSIDDYDRVKAYPLAVSAEGIELDNDTYLRQR